MEGQIAIGKLMPLLEHGAAQDLLTTHARAALCGIDAVREILHNRIENLRILVRMREIMRSSSPSW